VVKYITNLVLVLSLVASLACSGRVNNTTAGAVTGTAVGSGLGAIIGSTTGHTGAGTAIGAGVGALSGVLIGAIFDQSESENNRVRGQVEARDAEIAENQRLIDELRRSGTDATMTDRGVAIHLPDILFGFNRSDLSSDANGTIEEIARAIRDKTPGRGVLVEGHTDAVGSEEYNRGLSERRAESVALALIHGGVSRRQVQSKGFGKTRPIASNDTESGRQRNRRVEIIVER